MSNFERETKHPVTGEWENASWIDDKFGKHHYGVSFPSNPNVYYNPEEMMLETRRHKIENHEREEWSGWKIVSDMLDHPEPNGIYHTSECYQRLFQFVVDQKKKVLTEVLAKAEFANDARAIRHEIKEVLLKL